MFTLKIVIYLLCLIYSGPLSSGRVTWPDAILACAQIGVDTRAHRLLPVCCLRFVSDWTKPLDILSADNDCICCYLSNKGCLGNPTPGTNLGQHILSMRIGCRQLVWCLGRDQTAVWQRAVWQRTGKQCDLKHSETYRTPIFCTVPLPKVPLVPSKYPHPQRMCRIVGRRGRKRPGSRRAPALSYHSVLYDMFYSTINIYIYIYIYT